LLSQVVQVAVTTSVVEAVAVVVQVDTDAMSQANLLVAARQPRMNLLWNWEPLTRSR
jgi:hypothetical protein